METRAELLAVRVPRGFMAKLEEAARESGRGPTQLARDWLLDGLATTCGRREIAELRAVQKHTRTAKVT